MGWRATSGFQIYLRGRMERSDDSLDGKDEGEEGIKSDP